MIRVNAMQAISRIGRLKATIQKLGELPRRTAELAAPVITKLVQEQFDKGEDPYGRPWAPLAASTLAKGRRPPPLTETRRLREGTRAYVMRAHYAGLRVVVGAPYGYFHQVGFRVGRTAVKPRRILPQFGLPRAWSDALRAASRQAAAEAVRAL